MKPYKNLKKIVYYSKRYKKTLTVPCGFWSDGATGAKDIKGPHPVRVGPDVFYKSRAWLVHDKLCNLGKWNDGSLCTNWQASMVLHDILAKEGRWFRARSWFVGTWLFGGGKARDNSMW